MGLIHLFRNLCQPFKGWLGLYSVDFILESVGSVLGTVGSVLGTVDSVLGSVSSILDSPRLDIESLDLYFHYNGNIFFYYHYCVS